MNKSKDNKNDSENETKTRIKLPKGEEILGIIEQRLGGNRMYVKCQDGKTRNCRVPGRLRRRLWLRPGDTVIVEPWDYDDEKADVLYKYTKNQAKILKKKGHLKIDTSEF